MSSEQGCYEMLEISFCLSFCTSVSRIYQKKFWMDFSWNLRHRSTFVSGMIRFCIVALATNILGSVVSFPLARLAVISVLRPRGLQRQDDASSHGGTAILSIYFVLNFDCWPANYTSWCLWLYIYFMALAQDARWCFVMHFVSMTKIFYCHMYISAWIRVYYIMVKVF